MNARMCIKTVGPVSCIFDVMVSRGRKKTNTLIAKSSTCCEDFWEDFCGCCAGEMASDIQEIVYGFGPQLNTFMSVGNWFKYFRRKLLQFE